VNEGRVPTGIRNLPLPTKVIGALTVLLFPLGLLAAYMAQRGYSANAAGHHALTLQQWAATLLPLVMWLAALGIGWALANVLLVRPLLEMRRGVERYGNGDAGVRLGGGNFISQEMHALAMTFDQMADDISLHQSALEAALDEQKRLTREIHHRVKNNLQIVSSLLSLQARESRSAEVAYAYATVQTRVGALALVHRWMYDEDGSHGVDLRALASDLCASLEQGAGAAEQAPITVHCAVERIVVSQDTAVPIAFLITELIGLAARRASPDGLAAQVSATSENGRARLTVTAEQFVDDDGLGSGSPARRIIEGMARQLRAPLEHDAATGSYSVAFAVPPARDATSAASRAAAA